MSSSSTNDFGPSDSQPQHRTLGVALLLTALAAVGQVAISLYLPSLPSMAQNLMAPVEMVNLTLSLFLIGLAFGQLIYGPLSDRFGRRPVLYGGLALFSLAGLGCAVAPNIETLIAMRIAQAIGAAVGPVLSRAIVRDVYGAEGAAKMMAYMGLMFALVPALGPVLGGYLQVWAGWRSIFVVVAVIGVLVIVAVRLVLPETNVYRAGEARPRIKVRTAWGVFLRDRVFLGYLLVLACIFGGLMSFQVTAPYLLIDVVGLTPDAMGKIYIVAVGGFFIGTFFSGRYSGRVSTARMVLIGMSGALAGGVLMIGVALWGGPVSVWSLIGPFAFYGFGMGFAIPNCMAGAMRHYPRTAGSASALMGFVQMVAAGGVSFLAGTLPKTSALPLGLVLTGCMTMAFIGFFTLTWPKEKML